ncbi:hypothetical protein [Helicobacter sp. MIT 05-5293]|uniref:hypothetical protein n=1 Tax=Helicobacter sp. MIT 05-5293 TaxID=1548149 RepID=UPI0013153CB2|nr:hypothetical protein [Helicobacter sp. MIT 05-5293]
MKPLFAFVWLLALGLICRKERQIQRGIFVGKVDFVSLCLIGNLCVDLGVKIGGGYRAF